MAPFAVAISKRVAWRGVQEVWSNVYHYDLSSPITTESGWDSLIDQIVAIEKTIHPTTVTFVQGRAWGPTNQGPIASITQRIKDLSGTGTMAGGAELYRELSIVAQFYIGRNPATQRKRFLRKYFHTCRLPASAGGSIGTGDTPLATADKTPIVTAMNNLKTITVGGFANDLCTPQGDHLPVGSNPEVLNYLHVRQFKQ